MRFLRLPETWFLTPYSNRPWTRVSVASTRAVTDDEPTGQAESIGVGYRNMAATCFASPVSTSATGPSMKMGCDPPHRIPLG